MGDKIDESSVRIGGQPLNEVAVYRVTTNNFLASGGDGFSVFTRGTDMTVGPMDLDVLEGYLTERGPVAPCGCADRTSVIGLLVDQALTLSPQRTNFSRPLS